VNVNRQVVLVTRPRGIPQAEHFAIVESPVPQPEDGQILVRNIYLSVEPAMRGWVSTESNYADPVPIGSTMRSFATGRVQASRHPDFRPGDYVTGWFGWQDYACVDQASVERTITETDVPLSASLGVLGLNGFTAYFGLIDAGQPRPGETVLVSTAAGAVGSCVGQIATIMECRAVGIAGGPDKTKLCIDEFGFAAAIDYKADDLDAAIADACPDGVDVYFDNTAGAISDIVMNHLRIGARVVVCGTAAIASWDPPPQGPRVERHLLVKRARMQGILTIDYQDRFDAARHDLARWVREGRLRYREEVLAGLDHAPDAIAGLYRGENMGKRLIRIATDDALTRI
jgi:NADPH-dependent curcumin reductase CurA